MSEKHFFFNHWTQKTMGLVVPAVAATTLWIRVDHEQDHDHHESVAPIEATTNSMSASGTNTAAQCTHFGAQSFQAWTHGQAFWEVQSRPNLVLAIGSPRAGAPVIIATPRRF